MYVYIYICIKYVYMYVYVDTQAQYSCGFYVYICVGSCCDVFSLVREHIVIVCRWSVLEVSIHVL